MKFEVTVVGWFDDLEVAKRAASDMEEVIGKRDGELESTVIWNDNGFQEAVTGEPNPLR